MAKVPNKLINQWTPLHLLAGFAAAERGLTASQTLGWSIAYELAENILTSKPGAVKKFRLDSVGANNAMMDTVLNMAGFMAAKKLRDDDE